MEKPCNITPQERAKQYPGKFHADNNLLFCLTVLLLWITTKSQLLTCTFQLFQFQSSLKQVKQQTLKASFKCKTAAHENKVKVCYEWIRACATANITLNKSENPTMREFLLSCVVNCGAIPKGTQLASGPLIRCL